MDGLKTHQISTENFLTKSTNSINSFRTIYILKPLISIFRLLYRISVYLIFYNLNLSAKKTFVNVIEFKSKLFFWKFIEIRNGKFIAAKFLERQIFKNSKKKLLFWFPKIKLFLLLKKITFLLKKKLLMAFPKKSRSNIFSKVFFLFLSVEVF